jgi:hypothetical protein
MLVEAAQATLEALHPGYAARVGRLIVEDPLEPAGGHSTLPEFAQILAARD